MSVCGDPNCLPTQQDAIIVGEESGGVVASDWNVNVMPTTPLATILTSIS